MTVKVLVILETYECRFSAEFRDCRDFTSAKLFMYFVHEFENYYTLKILRLLVSAFLNTVNYSLRANVIFQFTLSAYYYIFYEGLFCQVPTFK